MHKTRRFVLLVIVASLLALLLVPLLWYAGEQIYLCATQGKIVMIDGVPQNDRIYIENACYDASEGKIKYTVVNNSSQRRSYKPDNRWIEKKIDGEWQIYVDDAKFKVILARPLLEQKCIYPAYGKSDRSLLVGDYWNEVTSGEYRIIEHGVIHTRTEGIVGKHEVVEWSVSYPEDGYCVVGYFTITEEMLTAPAS